MILDSTEDNIKKAAESLAEGGLVAMPTETVYGLGADATNDSAVASIFEAKGRPQFNPLIVHFDKLEAVEQEVELTSEAKVLASVFWPGPLTMVLPRKEDSNISLLCSAGLDTLAVRIPSYPIAKSLIKALGRPIAAPSANKSGSLSPTSPQHVWQSLGEKAGIILGGGKSEVGLESTVIDLSGEVPVLLRPGYITKEDIEAHIGNIEEEFSAKGDKPKSPGQLLKHYAPNTPLRLKAVDVKQGEALLAFGSVKFMGVAGGGFAKDLPEGSYLNLSEQGDLHEAASNLFAMLHSLDKECFNSIAVMDIPNVGLGVAINDRLKRAVEK